jgi:hypothetical protein
MRREIHSKNRKKKQKIIIIEFNVAFEKISNMGGRNMIKNVTRHVSIKNIFESNVLITNLRIFCVIFEQKNKNDENFEESEPF